MFKLVLEKAEEPEIQHLLDHQKSKRVPEKHLFLLYWLFQSQNCVDHNKLWKILKEMGIPEHLTCLLRNLYAGQEATVRTGHGTTDWFQVGKGISQGCILSPCLFNLYVEYIMRNAGLEEAQAAIKIARRNINNLRYADDTTLMTESKEELKSLLMKVKQESEKVGLKLNIQKTKIMASGSIISWEIDGETQRRQWQPTQALLPGKSHGSRSLVGCSPWGHEESDTTERLHFHFSLSCIGEGNGNPLQCSCLENSRDGGAWWAAVYGVAQSQTQLKWLSSSRWGNSGNSVRLYLFGVQNHCRWWLQPWN